MPGIAEQLADEILADRQVNLAQPPQGTSRAEMLADEILANSGSMLGGAKDAAVSVGLSIPQVLKSLADMGRMVVGDQPVINEVTGQTEQAPLKTISEGIEKATDWVKEKALSEAALAQERQFARYMADPNQTIADLPKAVIENPRAVANMGLESLGSMFVPAGAAVGAVRGVNALSRAAQAGQQLGRVSRALAAANPSRVAVGATAGTNAAMNAADTFSSTEEEDLARRYEGAALSGAASLAANILMGGAADKMLADMALKEGSRLARSRIANVLLNAGKGMGKEGAEEGIEELGNAAGEQLAERRFDPNEMLKRAGTGAAIGAGMGGAVGSVSGMRTSHIDPGTASTPQQSRQAAGTTASGLDELARQTRAAVEQTAAAQPQMPQQTSLPASSSVSAVSAPQPQTAPTQPAEMPKVVLQNRNRSSDASIQQMNAIAAKPDYLRVSGSHDFGNGAPVVSYGTVPQNQLGKQSLSVTTDGERIPVQYAVVEAGDVLTSNQVNGSANADYESAPPTRIRAIAGNGRVAGLTEAYRRGTASEYRSELRQDAQNLGIDPAVIDGMKAPILVRVMPTDRVRADIGDISNTSGNLSMNAVETAANDVNRIDFDKIVFNDNGEADVDTVIGFVRQMPLTEQGALIDTNGQPTRAAHERFANALFKKAYGDDELVRLSAQAADPEIRNVIAALSRVAPKMARLEGLGDLDIRSLVKQAAQVVVNAHRQGVALKTFAAQGDITMDPDVRVIVDCFAKNARSIKEMARVLEMAADFAYSEGTKDDVDMFGPVERATRQDVLNRIESETNGNRNHTAKHTAGRNQANDVRDQSARPQDLAESAGTEPAQENVQRAAGRAAADGRGSEDFERTQENGAVVVNSSEISAAKENRKEFRDEIKRRINEMYPEGTVIEVRVESDGEAVFVSKKTAKHTLGQRASWRSMLAALKLPQLMRSAHRVSGFEENPHADKREAVSGGYRYEAAIVIDGERFPVHIRVRQHPEGLRMYHAKVDDKKPSGFSGVGSDSSQRATPPALGSNQIVVEGEDNFQLTGQTEAEAQVEAARLQEIEDTGRRESEEAERRQREERIAKEERQAAERYRDEFSLEDDTVSADDAISGQQGLMFSRDREFSGERSESIRQSLSEDKQLGEAFSRLEDSGVVVIAEATEDLPDRIQEGIKGSRAANLDKERRYQNALTKLADALRNRTSAHRVVYNDALDGWIDIDWGKLGDIIDSITYQTKGAMGLSHVIDKRSIQVPLSPNDVAAVLKKMVRTLANGELRRTKKGGLSIESEGFRVSISRKPGGNAYVVTAVGSYKTEAVPSGQLGTATPIPATLRARNDLSPGTRSRNVSVLADIILQNELLFKLSEAGDIQAVYDPETGKSYLIASNIKPGDEKGVLVHEIGVHMAADRGSREAMRPLVARAQQIVFNGNANGDPTAKRVYQRLKDADLLTSRGLIKPGFEEEAFAYLAEEMVNAREKASSPIREWFEKVLSSIRRWLYQHGLFVGAEDLTARDLVSMAVANVRAMAEQGQLREEPAQDLRLSRRKDDADAKAKPVQNVLQESLEKGNAGWGFAQAPKRNRLRNHSFVERDELGNFVFGYGNWAYRHVGEAAHALFDFVDRKTGRNFNLNSLPREYRMAYREYKASVERAQRQVAQIGDVMSQIKPEERRLISDIIEKCVQPGINPPEHVVHLAASIQNLMDAQTDLLVSEGLLSEESAERWRGQYLPRLYLKQTELFDDAKESFRKVFGNSRGIGGAHLKGRGLFRTVSGEAEIRQHQQLGWEIRDPDWSDAQGELEFTGEGTRPKQPTVVMWRDFTPQERAQMGEERDALARLVVGYMQTQQDIALARFFKSLAQDSRFSRSSPNDDWVKVPESTIGDGSKIKRFGALAGRYVAPEVWASLEHYSKDNSDVSRFVQTLMAAWKEGKTALNPVAHVNNCVGNLCMAHFAGVNLWDARAYFNAIKGIRNQDVDYKEAQSAGLFSGSFSQAEILEMIPIEQVQKAMTGMRPTYEKLADVFMNVLSYGTRDSMRKAYEFEDQLFKFVIYQNARRKGLSAEQAVDYANQFIFTYDDLPSGARKLRDTVLPFFSWTYKAIPILLRTAMLYPHRYLAPAAVAFAVNKASYIMLAVAASGDSDDWEKVLRKAEELEDAERAALPDYAQGSSIYFTPKWIRLMNNDDGTANYLDVSRFVPAGDLMDLNNQMGGIPWLQPFMPGSPHIGLFLALFANKDSFTGREIVERTDSDSEALRKRLTYVYKSIAPAIAPGGYHVDRLGNAIAAETGTTITLNPFVDWTGTDWNGRPVEFSRAAMHTFGIKVRAVNHQQEIERKLRRQDSEIREIKGNVRFRARSHALGATSKESLDAYIEAQRKDIEERVKKIEEFLTKVEPIMDKNR